MIVHNYKSRQVHKTLNGLNPSCIFRDMRSASLDPICAKFDKFMGQMGKWPWQCTTIGLDNSTELRITKIRQAVTEIWVPQVWQPSAQPPAWTVTIPLQPGGLTGKKGFWLPAQNRSTWVQYFRTKTLQVMSDSTENKLNPIQFLIYYNVQFA